ncbi:MULTISPECIES: hypothetical protein [Sphingomonadales]|uniref:hypothetical protein n=1 Tax=Sphingomonadales TaxID=204457 RepID=UPI00326799B5
MWKNVLIFSIFILMFGCSEQQQKQKHVQLEPCWGNYVLEPGTKVKGFAIIYFNPDGPFSVYGTSCNNHKLNAVFDDRDIQFNFRNTLREQNDRSYLGGQYFKVNLEGVIGNTSSQTFGHDVMISQIELVEPLGKPVWLCNEMWKFSEDLKNK